MAQYEPQPHLVIHPWLVEQQTIDADMVTCAIARQCYLQECDFDSTLESNPSILYYAISHCVQSSDAGSYMINTRGETYVNIWTCFTSSPFFCQYAWNTTPLYTQLLEQLSVHVHDIQWPTLSRHAHACFMAILEEYASFVCWDNVWKNADNVGIQQQHVPTTRSQWKSLSAHPDPSMVHLLYTYKRHLCWTSVSMSQNPAIVPFLQENELQLKWHRISCNPNPAVVRMLINDRYDKIDWYWLSRNPNPDACALLQVNPDKINWIGFSWTQPFTHAVQWDIVDAHPDKVSWMGVTNSASKLCSVTGVAVLVKWAPLYHDQYDWAAISANPHPEYIPLIERWAASHKYEFNWDKLSLNPCPDILPLWFAYIEHINWELLCSGQNPALASFLSSPTLPDNCACWDILSKNANPSIYPMLAQHIDQLSCWNLCINKNPHIIDLLRQYPANIEWDILASNVHVVLCPVVPSLIPWSIVRHGNDTIL